MSRDVRGFKSDVDGVSLGDGGILGMFKGGGAFAAGFAAVQTGISAVTGVFKGLFSTIEQGESIADFAAQIGATTEELTGLRFAAEISGSSSEVMDAALQKMTQRLGEAREGSAETRAAFEALGLDLDSLANMTAGEQLKTIADQFKNVRNPADQAALAVDLFGKQGVRLVNVLKDGRAGIEALEERSRQLGNTLSGDDAAALSSAADAVDELKAAWNGLWNQLTILIVPALKEVVGWFTKVVGAVNNALRKVREFFGGKSEGSPLAEGASGGESPLAKFKEDAKKAEEAKKKMDEIFRQGASVTASLRNEQEKYNDTIKDLQKLLEVGAIGWDTYERGVRKAADELANATEQRKELDRLGSTPGVGSALAGSSAAYSAIQASNRLQADMARQQKQVQEQQLAESKRQSMLQQQMLTALQTAQTRRTTSAADI